MRGLPCSRADLLVVHALVSVAKGLGKRTVAEYVEGQETIELLRAYGVDCAQGFALGRPVAPVQAFAMAAWGEADCQSETSRPNEKPFYLSKVVSTLTLTVSMC